MNVKVFYILKDSERDGSKKPSFLNWRICFLNCVKHFGNKNITVIADNVEEESYRFVKRHVSDSKIFRTKLGYSKSFIFTISKALQDSDISDAIYIVDSDYLHLDNSKTVLLEGLQLANYVSLYDHLDKYMNPSPNPYVKQGGEVTKVVLSKSTHWKFTNSVYLSFACKYREGIAFVFALVVL